MQPVWHYLRLYSELGGRAAGGSGPISIGLPELAGILYCTERNVKLIIRKMKEFGWIDWQPGRGRGRVSQLSFLMPVDQVVLQESRIALEKGRLSDALEMMRVEEMGQEQRERFIRFLSGYFGYSVELDEKRETDVLRLPIYKTLSTLDPAFVFYSIDCYVTEHLFDPLLKYDRFTGGVKPHIAYAWESDDRMQTWTLRLRKGVRFHTGEELTAEHVKLSFERLERIRSPHAWLVSGIQEYEVAGRYKLIFRLEYPNAMFLHFLTCMGLSIVLESAGAGKQGDKRLVGTGPFRLGKQDERLVRLEANTEYFRERAHMDRVDLWFLPESIENVLTGGVDGDAPLVFSHRHPITPDDPSRMVKTVELGTTLLTLNTRKPGPLADPRLREAIDAALDRDRMTSDLGENRLGPAVSCLVTRENGNRPVANAGVAISDRLELARDRVKASGYCGETLNLYIYPKHEMDALWVRDRLAEIGIVVKVSVHSEEEMTNRSRIAEADMILYELIVGDSEQLSVIETLKMENSFIRAHADDTVKRMIDEEIRRLLGEPDTYMRMSGFERIEQKLIEERRFLPLLRKSLSMAHDPSLKGASINSLGWADLYQIWFD